MSEPWKAGIVFSHLTDVGMRRANNQDSHVAIPAENEDRFGQRGHLFVVADGMGAHAAGELASRMATEAIAMHYFRTSEDGPTDALRSAIIDANTEIHNRGQQNPEFHNMGTTASALAILPQGAVIAHVGDSRIYRLRDYSLEQLTFDHSLAWEMEASGQIHPDSALGQSIPKNVITRSLGPNPEVVVDVEGPLAIKEGDRFLLCSDGLSGLVGDPRDRYAPPVSAGGLGDTSFDRPRQPARRSGQLDGHRRSRHRGFSVDRFGQRNEVVPRKVFGFTPALVHRRDLLFGSQVYWGSCRSSRSVKN